jgi:hypothetical protein
MLHVHVLFLDVYFWRLCPFSCRGSLVLYALSFHNYNMLYSHGSLSQLQHLPVRRPQLCGVRGDENFWCGDGCYYCDRPFSW